ncbi:MAG: glycosyltransferase family 2 protein [Vicinamibacteria bacterium]
MSHEPTVSVVIPCYNGAAFLRETLASVLAQTHPVLEVIVVDDGSTDDSAEIAASFGPPVRVIRQPNQGESVARNRGVRESRGEWIAFLDADDAWLPNRIEAQFAQCPPDAVAVHCNLIFFGAENYTTQTEETPTHLRYSLAELCCRNCFHTPSAIIVRRDVCPSFPERIRYAEDLLFFLEIVQAGLVSLCTAPLVRYRQHKLAQSFKAETRVGWFKTIDAWIAQNRDKISDDAAESVRQFWLQELARFAWSLKDQRRWDEYWYVRRFLEEHKGSTEVDEVLSHHVFPRMLYWLKDRFERLRPRDPNAPAR